MLLSVPLTMIFKIGLESSEEGKWLAVLLSGDEIEEEILQEDESNAEKPG